MSLTVFLAVLAAAFLHAGWNALIRQQTSKAAGIGIMTLVQGGFGVVLALTQPMPGAPVWWWLAASGVFHAGYKLFLALAYERGDLSGVYPLARGAAPMLVLLVSVLILNEALSGPETLGIVILGAGIVMMAQGVFTSGEDRRMIPLALGSAVMTAGYSILDGLGARAAGDATQFVAWLFIIDAILFTPAMMTLRGRRFMVVPRRAWVMGTLAAFASFLTYLVVVWAMTQAPIALVTALRETSILFAVLIGWLVFRERMDAGKASAALLIVTGVVLTRI